MSHQSIFRPTTKDGFYVKRNSVRGVKTGFATSIVTLLKTWMERSRQRRALAKLDNRMFADIGVTREQAMKESCTPFWATSDDDQ